MRQAMERLLAIGMIAATVLASGMPAGAQTGGRRIVYCQPKPFCGNGQISVCQAFGDADDACVCKRWSRCFGETRTPSRPAPPGSPGSSLQRPIPPRIEIPSTR
jgi:hypothetical protein